MGSLGQRSMHVHKASHVPHEAKSQFSERQGRKKKNIFKEISFSLLIYEFHEKGAIFFSF